MTTKMESQAAVDTIFTEDPDSSAYEYRETLEKILLQLFIIWFNLKSM